MYSFLNKRREMEEAKQLERRRKVMKDGNEIFKQYNDVHARKQAES